MMGNGHISSCGLKEIVDIILQIRLSIISSVKAKSFLYDFAFLFCIKNRQFSPIEENYRFGISMIILY